MEHLVKFTTAEGREGQHVADGLDDALRFVERLRNTEEVSAVRVFRMQEVPIEFRTYYKVELKAGEAAEPSDEAEAVESEGEPAPDGQGETAQPLVATPSVAPEPAENGATERDRKLFARG